MAKSERPPKVVPNPNPNPADHDLDPSSCTLEKFRLFETRAVISLSHFLIPFSWYFSRFVDWKPIFLWFLFLFGVFAVFSWSKFDFFFLEHLGESRVWCRGLWFFLNFPKGKLIEWFIFGVCVEILLDREWLWEEEIPGVKDWSIRAIGSRCKRGSGRLLGAGGQESPAAYCRGEQSHRRSILCHEGLWHCWWFFFLLFF